MGLVFLADSQMLSDRYLYICNRSVVTYEQYVVSPVTDSVLLNSVMLVEMHLSESQV